MRGTLIIIALFAIIVFLPIQSYATDISDCVNLPTGNTTYFLTTNIIDSANSTCMSVNANDITLDCQGNTIDGVLATNTWAIYAANKKNITIQNCYLTNWYEAILLRDGYAYNFTIINNSIVNNKQMGLESWTINDSTISFNNISYNNYSALSLLSVFFVGGNVTIANNTLCNNPRGVDAQSIFRSTIANNTICSSAIDGVYLTTGGNNTINSNNITSNRFAGIYINWDESYDNVTNNTFTNNSKYAVYSGGGSRDVISGNTIWNESNGIYLSSTRNTISYNDISHTGTAIRITGNLNNITYNNLSSNNIGTRLFKDDGSWGEVSNNTIVNNSYTLNTLALYAFPQYNLIENNTFTSNVQGIVIITSGNTYNYNTLNNNSFWKNGNDVVDYTAWHCNTKFDNNTFYLPDNVTFLNPNLPTTGTVNTLFEFDFSVGWPNGTLSDYTLNSIDLYPSIPFEYSSSSGSLVGNFTPVDSGINSLYLDFTMGTNNITAYYPFMINGSAQETVTYYLRNVDPAHGQPAGLDPSNSLVGKSLLLSAPTSEETPLQNNTQIFSVDESPTVINNVRITQINSSILYVAAGTPNIGFQKIVSPDNSTDVNTSLPAVVDYTLNTTLSSNLNWTLASPEEWWRLGGKLFGSSATWKTNNTNMPTVTFTYEYAVFAPKVLEITPGAKVISSAANSSSYAAMAIEGDSPANITVQMPSSSNYTIYYDDATCSSPDCNAIQTDNNITLSLALGSVHTIEFIIPPAAPEEAGPASGNKEPIGIETLGVPEIVQTPTAENVVSSALPQEETKAPTESSSIKNWRDMQIIFLLIAAFAICLFLGHKRRKR